MPPRLREVMVAICADTREGVDLGPTDVRFGSKADMCVAKSDVCFTPNSDRESGLPQEVMSALPPKADMCSAKADVCFGPIADSCTAANNNRYSITLPARARSEGGTVRPSSLAVFILIVSSNLVDAWTGRPAGLVPLRIWSTYPAARRN